MQNQKTTKQNRTKLFGELFHQSPPDPPHPPPLLQPCSFQSTRELMLHGSFIAFVIAGTHQHSYNHAALGSPTRTPKNGKEKKQAQEVNIQARASRLSSVFLTKRDPYWGISRNIAVEPWCMTGKKSLDTVLTFSILPPLTTNPFSYWKWAPPPPSFMADWITEVSHPIPMNIFL